MKAKRIVEPSHDPNGGQYIPTSPQYSAGYADGFKAGKEWMRSYLRQRFGDKFMDDIDGKVLGSSGG